MAFVCGTVCLCNSTHLLVSVWGVLQTYGRLFVGSFFGFFQVMLTKNRKCALECLIKNIIAFLWNGIGKVY